MEWLIGHRQFKVMAGWVESALGIQADTLAHLLDTVLAVLAYYLLRRLLRVALLRKVSDSSRRWVVSKTINYILGVLTLLIIAKIWLQANISLATYLGILSAGLAVALQDPIANLAGWLFIIIRQPFRVGDRIQVGDHAGDVIDTRLFMFSLLEIGNWVKADQATGRIIHVPNGRLFKAPVANYTQGFEYIWDEIPVTVTFESDWKRAQQILDRIANEHSERLDQQMTRQIQDLTHKFNISFRHLTPIVWVEVVDIGVNLTLRYLCHPRRRRSTEDTIWRAILDAFAAEPTIDFAYPTQRFYDNAREGKPGAGGPARNEATPPQPGPT